jgi:hypothetical protein
MNNDKMAFLYSPRFWHLFAVGLSVGLEEYNRTGRWQQALAVTISIWLGGSTVVRTFDRATEVKPVTTTTSTISAESDPVQSVTTVTAAPSPVVK